MAAGCRGQLQPNLASFGHAGAPAGHICTTRGHPIVYYMLVKNSFNSKGRQSHVAWSQPSLPDSIVLLGGDDEAEFTAEIVPGF